MGTTNHANSTYATVADYVSNNYYTQNQINNAVYSKLFASNYYSSGTTPYTYSYRNPSTGGITNGKSAGAASATGTLAIALGADAVASGNYSTAIGLNSTASGLDSTAMGYQSRATAADSTALGESSIARGMRSTAVGHSSVASGQNSTAVGSGSAYGIGSVALGSGSVAGTSSDDTVTDGVTTASNARYALALGSYARAEGLYSIAIGSTDAANMAVVFADQAVALGAHARVNAGATNSVAIGYNSSVSSSITNAVALGQGSQATVSNTISVGSSSIKRRIMNVDTGTADNDAVNVAQLTSMVASAAAPGVKAGMFEQMHAYLADSTHGKYTLSPTKGTNTHSVKINNTPYYYTPNEKNADMVKALEYLAASQSLVSGTESDYVFYDGTNYYKYNDNATSIPSHANRYKVVET